MMFDKLIKKLIFCAIMVLVISSVVFAEELDPDDLESHPVTVSGTSFDVYPAVMYNHFAVTKYDAVKGIEYPNNFYGPLNDKATVKYGSYGLYNFNENTNLFAFIKYCKTKNTSLVTSACDFDVEINGVNERMNFSKLLEMGRYAMTAVTYDCVKKFFNNMMSNDADAFIELQDQFIFEKYAKLGISATHFNDSFVAGSTELSTAFMSIIYSYYKEDCINPNVEDSKSNIDVKSGNVRMFLYKYSMKDGSFVDDKDKLVSDAGLAEKIAKFAYIGLIYGGESKAPGTNYWENEYEQLFGDDMLDFVRTNDNLSEDMSDEDVVKYIKSLYSKAKTKYNEKGEKGNPLLGSDISRIIQSQYSMENRLNATKDYLQRITGGKFNDNIAKNYLMARYMMENEEINNTIDDYCPGVVFDEEKFRRGSFDDDKTKVVITSDFQILTLKDLVSKKGSTDSDQDGLYDGQELASTSTKKDITNFLDLAYKNEGLSDTEIKSKKEKLVEFGPNGYTYDPVTGAVTVKVYDYTSNPKLKDTDFDGIGDSSDNDKLDSNFKGTMKIEDNSSMNIDFNQDFRYFFIDPKSYNDELAVMSLIPANLANGKDTSLSQKTNVGNFDIESYMRKIGFTGVNNINLSFNGKGYYGIKEIDYYGVKKKVLGLFFGGFNNEESYKKLLCKGINEEDDETVSNLYSSILTECENQIENIVNDIDSSYCIWISGYGIAGTVASNVAKNLTAGGEEVYAYIFGVPTSSYSASDGEYENIKIIVNEDDLIQKIRPEKEGYTISGKIYNKSVGLELEDEYRKYVGNPASYSGNYMVTNTISENLIDLNHKAKNNNEPAKDYRSELPILLSDLASFLCKNYHKGILPLIANMGSSNKKVTTANVASDILAYKDSIVSAHSIKSYYVLAKSLDGYDDRAYYDLTEYSSTLDFPYSKEEWGDKDSNEELLYSLKTMGEWYVNHLATYRTDYKHNNVSPSANANTYYNKVKGISSRYKVDSPNRSYYRCQEQGDDENGLLHGETLKNGQYGKGVYTRTDVGDDCSGFAMATYYYMNGGYKHDSNKNITLKSKEKSAPPLTMNSLELRRFDLNHADFETYKEWVKKNLGIYIYDSEDISIDNLEPGDAIVTSDHIEFYIGYIYANKINSSDYEWIKVSDLTSEYEQYSQYFDKDGNDMRTDNQYSTFGWGWINPEFPNPERCIYKTDNGNFKFTGSTKEYELVFSCNSKKTGANAK